MLFNSQVFIVGFLPVVLALYYALAASRTARQALVVLASLVFYAWWDVRFVPLLAGLTVANWLVAQWFGAWRAAGSRCSESRSTSPCSACSNTPTSSAVQCSACWASTGGAGT